MPMEASIPVLIRGGERQAGALRSCVAAVDQAWPGRVLRPAAQPQRSLEGVQHQLGAVVSGGGSAGDGPRVDLRDESGVDDSGPGRPGLKPAIRRQLGADTVNPEPSGQTACALLPGTVVRLGDTAQRPTMAQRLTVAPITIPYTVRSHTARLRLEDRDVNPRPPHQDVPSL
jgi:hypothetical protein